MAADCAQAAFLYLYAVKKHYVQMEDQQKKVSVALPPDVAQGVYANLAIIAHSPSEFVIDFVRSMPGVPQPTVKSRVIMTPDNAKKFLAALQENVGNYERQYGEIEERQPGTLTVPFGFSGHQGNA